MQGYKLSEGKYNTNKISKDEMWDVFNWLFSSHSRNDASYKFIFLKSIIDCIDKKDSSGRISFDILFTEFTKISWNLILKYGISQKGEASDGRVSTLERVLRSDYTATDDFATLFDEDRKRICRKVKNVCKKYVVGALYGDTEGIIYSFSKKEEWIQMNPMIEEFIKTNMGLIENLNYYKWAQFYQLNNDKRKESELQKLIDSSTARKNENVYRSILASEFEKTDNIGGHQATNTIELLIASSISQNKPQDDIDDNDNIEKEMFKDSESLKKYLSDPVLLLEYIMKQRDIQGKIIDNEKP